ncbi:MAG: Uncharacterized protein XD61_1418 [Thermococcus sp. 40_45]|nr:MAG: Uncharacterized protein XD61_1418 [Thermococcus sp. 40_45]
MEKVPQLFVESTAEECVEDGKAKIDCIVIQKNVEVRLKKEEKLPAFIDIKKAKFMKKEVYDRFHFYVDKYEHRMICDVIIVLPDRRTEIRLYKGDELMLLPVEGYVSSIIAEVGNRVRKSDAFAAITTKKGEVHYLKPPKNGTVVYIDEFTNRPHYVYYLLPEER